MSSSLAADEFLTIDEFAALIKADRQYIYHLNSRGEGPPRYRGMSRTLLYKREEIAAWVESRRVTEAEAD